MAEGKNFFETFTTISENFRKMYKILCSRYLCMMYFPLYLMASNSLVSMNMLLVIMTSECYLYSDKNHDHSSQLSDKAGFVCEYRFREIVRMAWLVLYGLIAFCVLVDAITLSLNREKDNNIFNLDKGTILKSYMLRQQYVMLHPVGKDFLYEVNSLRNEINAGVIDLHHPNLLLVPIFESKFYVSGEEFMFGASHVFSDPNFEVSFPPPYFKALAIFMRDILMGIKYLHDRHIYHLDVQPKNILLLNSSMTSDGYMAKIGGFTFAKSTDNKEVSRKEIGLDEFKRPLECFFDETDGLQIEGDKFDCWSIGITAYELFTGGMLSVEFDRHPGAKNLFDLMRVADVMNMNYFLPAMDSRWQVAQYLESGNPFSSSFWDISGQKCYRFGKNYLDFVNDLLKFDPKLRSTVETALSAALMRDVNNVSPGKDDLCA